MPPFNIGVDIGGTNIVCGLVNDEGRVVRAVKAATESRLGSGAVLEKVAAIIAGILRDENLNAEDISAVGVGCPGHVDPNRGIALYASNLGWKDVEVTRLLSERLGIPVYVDNDVRMYVYGEAMAGAGKGCGTVLGITLGTGLAAAVVSGGTIYYGGNYLAGELGHIPLDGISYPCACGMTGCLETVASATGIARQAREGVQRGDSSLLSRLEQGELTAAAVSKAYDLQDPLAIEVMNRTGRLLGKGLAFAVTLFSPDILVVGGGVAAAGERLLKPMKEEILRTVHPMYGNRLAVATAIHLEYAGVIGSALFAKERRSAGIKSS